MTIANTIATTVLTIAIMVKTIAIMDIELQPTTQTQQNQPTPKTQLQENLSIHNQHIQTPIENQLPTQLLHINPI